MQRILTSLSLSIALTATPCRGAGKDPNPVTYRTVKPNATYQRPDSAQPFLAIKVTPPTAKGPTKDFAIEIVNMGKVTIAVVTFDLTIVTTGGAELSSSIQGDDIRSGQAAIKKLKPATKESPQVTKVSLDNVRIIDTNATALKMPVYVDLVAN